MARKQNNKYKIDTCDFNGILDLNNGYKINQSMYICDDRTILTGKAKHIGCNSNTVIIMLNYIMQLMDIVPIISIM